MRHMVLQSVPRGRVWRRGAVVIWLMHSLTAHRMFCISAALSQPRYSRCACCTCRRIYAHVTTSIPGVAITALCRAPSCMHARADTVGPHHRLLDAAGDVLREGLAVFRLSWAVTYCWTTWTTLPSATWATPSCSAGTIARSPSWAWAVDGRGAA